MRSFAFSGEDASLAERPGAWPKAAPVDGPRLGQPLQLAADRLRAIAEQLKSLVDQTAAADLAALIDEIAAQTYRIAVIGQVKAGKSSLVNALVRRPELIPTDVNPWTAVVTNLHFGQRAAGNPAAVFQFFDDADWDHLASGGRLHELTMRLGIPVDQNTLISQVRTMRERAEARLGRQFHHLLGKQHRFSAASSDILARYVCVGETGATDRRPLQPVSGRFADITKAADLYLEDEPFAYPTTIIDTPGTNDPFLVRDEITRQQLEKADVYIVVLTAQQALSSADLGLLRLLHGLHKQRLVVFVNRIDLLGDIGADAARVAAHTRASLAEEFPGSRIPVVFGSARWGEIGLGGAALSLPIEAAERFIAYARHRGALGSGREISARSLRRAMIACSGRRELEAAIAALMPKGPAMLALQRARTTVAMILASSARAAHSEVRALGALVAAARRDTVASERQLKAQERQIAKLDATLAELEDVADAIRQDITTIKDAAIQGLKAALGDLIRQFAREQAEALRAEFRRSGRTRIWRCDIHRLRSAMERRFLDRYRQSAAETTDAERRALARLQRSIGEVLDDYQLTVDHGQVHMIDPAPSISALGRTVALDLGEEWARWWRRWRSVDQRVQKLQELIEAEFMPVAGALADSAEAELDTHRAITTQRFASTCRELIALVHQRRSHVRETINTLLDRGDRRRTGSRVAGYEREHRRKQTALKAHDAIAAELQALERLDRRAAALPGAIEEE